MQDLKGLILSGGKGTRLRPITHTSAKQLVPVANKPVLFYGIEAMAQAGIDEVGIIIAPETGDEIRAAAGDGSRFGVRLSYIVQDEPLGLAHAVLTAEPFLGDSPFVMYLGDNLLQCGIEDLVAAFRENAPDALILLTPVPDPEQYGVAELEDGVVVRLVEKPPSPRPTWRSSGCTCSRRRCTTAARAIKPSGRGELEITDAIQHLVDQGMRVEPHIVQGLVEGHRPPRGHARGQPPGAGHDRGSQRRRAGGLAGRRPRGDRDRAPDWSAPRCADRRSSAPAPR